MATAEEKQLMCSLWHNHTLTDVAVLMKRSKSWVHRVSNEIGLPAKPQNFRKRTSARLELGKQALILRRKGWKWQDVANKLRVASRGAACDLASIAERAEIDDRAKAA